MLSPDDEQRVMMLTKAIDSCIKDLLIYRDGIKEERGSLDQVFEYLDTIHEALDYLRTSEAIVSMAEYKKMKSEIVGIKTVINAKKIAISNLEDIIREKLKDLKHSQEVMEKIKKKNRRGVVLNFKRKK